MTEAQSPACYSHPEEEIRHSYPLAVRSDGFGTAFGLCLKTTPYLLVWLGVLTAFTLAAFVWLGLCAGLAVLFSGKDGSGGGGLLFLIGLGIPAGAYLWFRKYVLYLFKMGHVAIITRLITEGRLPEGVNQVQYGKRIVQEHFAQANLMFVLDSLITGVVRSFNNTLDWVAGLLPIPGLDGMMRVVNAVLRSATTYIDETIFSYNIARADGNAWRSSADGLVYYAQNAKPVLKTAVIVLLLEYLLSFVLFIVLLAPMALISRALPESVAGIAWVVFAVMLAFNLRAALLHPIFLTMVALTFHTHAHGQKINLDMAGVLSAASSKFDELAERSKRWLADQGEAEKVQACKTPAETAPA